MAIIVGTEDVSDGQWDMLRESSVATPLRDLAEMLRMLLNDDDIISGDETLHPEWLSIYQHHRDRLANYFRLIGIAHATETLDGLSYVDSHIADINPSEETIAFLLGAGASKPNPSGIPTVTELLPELLNRARRLDREQVTSLADFCSERGIDNIEDLLTSVQISAFCSKNPRILRLVEFQLFRNEIASVNRRRGTQGMMRTDVSSIAYLQDTLQVLFGLLSNLMLPASPNAGHDAIVSYIGNNLTSSIITTNYDCCIDLALLENQVPYSYSIDFANSDVFPNPSEAGAPLIKLHGSLNWFYCETCQKVQLIDISRTIEDYENHRAEYPVISVCRECGGQKRGLLVPPHAMKFDAAPPLQPLIARADSYFAQATLIVVVGFSFADADSYISQMLIKAMQASSKTRLVIIDPDRSISEKIRRKFATQIQNFHSESRIFRLQGDCSDLLPRFLRGDLFQPHEDTPTSPAISEGEAAYL